MKTLVEQATGTAPRGDAKVSQPAVDHIQSMDESQLTQHIQTAAGNANKSGDTGTATILEQVLSGKNLKEDMIVLLRDDPQILKHFAPEFAQDILARL